MRSSFCFQPVLWRAGNYGLRGVVSWSSRTLNKREQFHAGKDRWKSSPIIRRTAGSAP